MARDRARDIAYIIGDQKMQRQIARAALPPQPLRTHGMLQLLHRVGVAREDVQPRFEPYDAMHEQRKVHVRRLRPSVPRRRADARDERLEHRVESFGGDRGHTVEVDRAAALANNHRRWSVEQRSARWRLTLRFEP